MNDSACSMRTVDGVYKDGTALHCYRIATKGAGSLEFDVTAEFPGGRWCDVWKDVIGLVAHNEFPDRVRLISKKAMEIFAQDETQEIIRNPTDWTKSIKGPLVKQEVS